MLIVFKQELTLLRKSKFSSFFYFFYVCHPCSCCSCCSCLLSGDLKDPSKSIPLGTILAIGAAIVTYVILVFTIGASFPRSTLVNNMNMMQEACWSRYIVVTGIVVSSISSALGSLFGGSRVLQALAKDDLFPCLRFFAKGTEHGDEPRRAVFFTWLFAQCCLFLGAWLSLFFSLHNAITRTH